MSSKSSSRSGKWVKHSVFRYRKLDEAGTALHYFETDQAKTDTPTLYLDSERYPPKVKSGIIKRIHYRLNPTNGETYTLRIWSDNIANDYESNLELLYESPAAQADDTDYDRCELNIPFVLDYPGQLFYSIDWTGTPGDTPGFIEVSGEVVRH